MPTQSSPFFQPFGSSSPRYPFWNRIGTCAYDHSLNLDQALAAKFLPRIAEDASKQLPVTLYPGTIVGVLNTRDHTQGSAATFTAEKPGILVPASGVGYKISYSALDYNHARYGTIWDLDTGIALASAKGLTTATLGAVIPLGLVQEPVFCEATQQNFKNFRFQSKINVLTRGRQFRVPCITDEEKLIFPGDLVMVSDTAGNHVPLTPRVSYPGRWKKFDPTNTLVDKVPYIVGQCVDRRRIASNALASEGDEIATGLGAGDTLTNLNTDQQYDTLGRIQTPPGLSLQGGGTQGVLASQTFARADASGDFWEIDIAIGGLGA